MVQSFKLKAQVGLPDGLPALTCQTADVFVDVLRFISTRCGRINHFLHTHFPWGDAIPPDLSGRWGVQCLYVLTWHSAVWDSKKLKNLKYGHFPSSSLSLMLCSKSLCCSLMGSCLQSAVSKVRLSKHTIKSVCVCVCVCVCVSERERFLPSHTWIPSRSSFVVVWSWSWDELKTWHFSF